MVPRPTTSPALKRRRCSQEPLPVAANSQLPAKKGVAASNVTRDNLDELVERMTAGAVTPEAWTDAESSDGSSSTSVDDANPKPSLSIHRRTALDRSRKRLRKFFERVAQNSNKPNATPLVDGTLSLLSQRKYLKSWKKFTAYAKKRGYGLAEASEVDTALVNFFNVEYLSGHQAWNGEVTMAALMHYFPNYGRYGTQKIPRAWRNLKGWRKLTPQRSRRPHPLRLWTGMSLDLVARGYAQMAVFIMISLSCYLRPTTAMRIRRCDLIPPQRGISQHWCLLASPEDAGVPGKTGTYDDRFVLDSSYLAGQVLTVLRADGSSACVWAFDWPDFLRQWRLSKARLGVRDLVPYMLRHSGASIDRQSHARLHTEVQKRGIWKQHRSMARYEKGARLGATAATYDLRLRAYLDACDGQLEAALLGRATSFPVVPHG